jgi:hypothetical protein
MRAFFAAVLSVIAVGVMLIAYGLLNPRTPFASDAYAYSGARQMPVTDRFAMADEGNGYVRLAPYRYADDRRTVAYPVNDIRILSDDDRYPARRSVRMSRQTTRSVPARAVKSGRDWTKTALVIGGTTATAAGLGAIFGGKKGALIGAAIGGGAGTLYEVKKR